MLESFHPWHFLCSVSFVSARTEALRVISAKVHPSKRFLVRCQFVTEPKT